MKYYVLMATLTVHALGNVFWAGSTSTMASLGGSQAARLVPFQMGSAALAVLTGLALWYFELGAVLYTHEQILLAGIAAAVIAAVVQGNVIGRPCRALPTAPEGEEESPVARMTKAKRTAASLILRIH